MLYSNCNLDDYRNTDTHNYKNLSLKKFDRKLLQLENARMHSLSL